MLKRRVGPVRRQGGPAEEGQVRKYRKADGLAPIRKHSRVTLSACNHLGGT
jgi:hypothetical protein